MILLSATTLQPPVPLMLADGTATDTVILSTGTHIVTATYNGDTDFAPSTGGPITLTLPPSVELGAATSFAVLGAPRSPTQVRRLSLGTWVSARALR